MASTNYRPPRLTRAQKRALQAAARRDTQLQYGQQIDSIRERQQLEAGQGALIDAAYDRYKTQLRDSEAQRTAANAAAVQGVTDMVKASGESMGALAAAQGLEADATNALTGATQTGSPAFRAAMLKSLQQQGVDSGQALVDDQVRRTDYSKAQGNQAESDRAFYRQKSADRSMKLADEQAKLRGTMAKAEQQRKDELVKQQFERWMNTEKVKLANREVDVNDSNSDADRSSREGSASYQGTSGGGGSGGGNSAPGGLTRQQKTAWDNRYSAIHGAYASVKRLAADRRYAKPNGAPDWEKIWKQVPDLDQSARIILMDIAYPGKLGKVLSPRGKSIANRYFYGELPKWLKGWL